MCFLILPRRHLCLPCILSWIALLLLVGTLAFPYYYETEKVKSDANGECDILFLVGWTDSYCSASGAGCASLSLADCNGTQNWHNDPEKLSFIASVTSTTKTSVVFWYSLVLVAVACLAALIIVIGVILMCCFEWIGGVICLRCAYLIIGLVGLACLTASIIGFGVQHNMALKDDGCSSSLPHSPCDSFSGTASSTDAGITYSYAWGGAGWIISLVAWPFLLAASVCVCRARLHII